MCNNITSSIYIKVKSQKEKALQFLIKGMAINIFNLVKNINLQIRETTNPIRINMKNTTIRVIIVKLLKFKYRDLKSNKRKMTATVQGIIGLKDVLLSK